MSNKQPPFKKTILSVAIPTQTELNAKGQIRAETEAGIVREVTNIGRMGVMNMECDPTEKELCMRIAIRGAEFMRNYGVEEDVLTAAMDVCAVHLNYQPLRLLAFALGDVSDFAHDYSRIRRLINRTTGRLPDGIKLIFAEKTIKTH